MSPQTSIQGRGLFTLVKIYVSRLIKRRSALPSNPCVERCTTICCGGMDNLAGTSRGGNTRLEHLEHFLEHLSISFEEYFEKEFDIKQQMQKTHAYYHAAEHLSHVKLFVDWLKEKTRREIKELNHETMRTS